ncbi:diguanylate cyclase [Geobacter sp. DSM 9736]|uniref:diguanylate cyclase n=1 Tax=Geobacter sp. DSM 9736 TaxID=1277350 RepID=UPI000B4FFBC5|nr:diguanylate cyclase [Geobacter sp. DSM 9736]SNB46263.1 diguanylate cyclase (GGDEF) domain-containing protein [Geobacter sp. DSM 9736]
MTTSYHKEMSLKNWQNMFKDIYYPAQNYGRSKFEILAYLFKTVGTCSYYLFRVQDSQKTQEYVSKIFSWYCALATRMEVDLEDAIWQKYPLVCPRCLLRKCECSSSPVPVDPVKLSMISLENSHNRPESLRDWQTMFGQLYRGPNGVANIPHSRERLALIYTRIVEEIGEVSESMRLDPVVDADARLILKNEIADLGAWIFSLANNLHCMDSTANGANLADLLWRLYPGKCNRCNEPKCACIRGAYSIELAEKGAMSPSHWDDLTGLANKKALKTYVNYASREFANGDYSWSIIFLDLDDFGEINKTHSHQIGDEILREAAKRMERIVDKSGIVFRRGGEEFVIVLRQRNDQALITAELVRRKLEYKSFKTESVSDGVIINVTASLGVASCTTDATAPEHLENIAESRSREAKKAGKNCVVPAPSQESLRLARLA